MKIWRPNSLLNIDDKKTITNRLGIIMSKIIHIYQTCRVNGRSSLGNEPLGNIQNKLTYLAHLFVQGDKKAFERVNYKCMQ